MRLFLRHGFLLALMTVVALPVQAQAWRTAALQRIEQHRKGTFSILVLDDEGNPVPNATVRVDMQRHEFGFGTAVTYGMLRDGDRPEYREKVFNLTGDGRTFNMVVFGNAMKWPFWESNQNKSALVTQVAGFVARGIDVRGHTLVWPSAENLPLDVRQHLNDETTDYLYNRIRTHIRGTVGYRGFRNVVREWDVLNEPAHLFDIKNAFAGKPGYPTGEEIYADMFRWAREADPKADLYINDYNIVAYYSPGSGAVTRYRQIIQNIIDAGAPLDGIGMQGHFNPGSLTSMDNVWAALEDFGRFGKKIAITEYDVARVQPVGQCIKSDEAEAAAYMRNFLTMVFSHPLVESFTIWGFWDGDHWRCDAPLFRNDWSLKPSGEQYMNLVFDEWWTNETATTDAEGRAVVRGFLGDYVLTAELPDTTLETKIALTENDTLSVSLSAFVTGADSPAAATGFEVLPNYPEPFSDATLIEYALAAPADVRLEVYDLLGRRIHVEDAGRMPAGRHTFEVRAGGLPTGPYLYRLTAGEEFRTGRLTVVR